MGIQIFHRIALFLAGVSIMAGGIQILPAVGLSKPATALLGITTFMSLVVRRRPIPVGAKHLWAGLFAVMLVASFGYSMMQGLPWQFMDILALSYFSVIGFYFLLSVAIFALEDADSLVAGVILGGVLASISVLLGYGASEFGTRSVELRTGGLSGDPNYFAMGTAASAMIAVYPLLQARSIVTRGIVLVAILIMIAGTLSSLSRGGLIALGLAGLFLVYRLVRWGHPIVIVPALMVVLAIPVVLPQDVRERLLTLSTSSFQLDSSIQSRLDQYDRGLTMFASSPLIGVGAGRSHLSEAFGGAVSRQDLRAYSAEARHHNVIHNSFLIILVETGLLGMLPYVMIYLLSFLEFSKISRMYWSSAYRDSRRVRNLVWMGAMLQAGLVALTIAGLFLNASRFKPLWMTFGLATALLALARAAQSAEEPELEPDPSLDSPTPTARPVHG